MQETLGFGEQQVLDTSDPLPKVLLVGGDGNPSGVPRHILHLATAFQSFAHVTVASDLNKGGYDDLVKVGATHETVPGLQSRLSLTHLWRGWRGLTRLLRQEPHNLVWLHARLPVLLGRLALTFRFWRPEHSVAITYHGLPFGPGHRPLASRISRMIERTLLLLGPPLDLVFLSQSAASTMQETLGPNLLKRHRVHVLPNCSDLGNLPSRSRSDHRHLVMTGRVGWQKNYELAAQTLAFLPDDFHLTLCGSGTETETFQSNISELVRTDVSARIHYAGPVRDVRPYLMSADGYLLCSRYEGMPIGALEAFEAGLPIILSRFEGAEDLATKHPYSLTLDFTDIAQDAGHIEHLINSYRASMPEAAEEIRTIWEEEWSPNVFAKNAHTLLEKLVRS